MCIYAGIEVGESFTLTVKYSFCGTCDFELGEVTYPNAIWRGHYNGKDIVDTNGSEKCPKCGTKFIQYINICEDNDSFADLIGNEDTEPIRLTTLVQLPLYKHLLE